MRNELATETQTLAGQAARVVSYSYDADGLGADMTAPSGRLVEYDWTTRAQLAAVTADGPPPFADYEYDKAGRLLKTIHENGITEEKNYDAASQLLSNLHKQAGTTVSGHNYGYDATGRRTSETFPGSASAARTYGYDTADQVTSANYGNSLTDAYNYDAMGNRTSATVASQSATFTYTANNANQYTSITGLVAPPIHDANGNLLSQNGVNYTWDSENRLLSVSDGTTTNTFSYDGNHRRVTKRTAVSGTVTEKTHFIYDGWNVIEEYTNADTTPGFNLTTFAIARTYTWGNDLSGTLQGAGGVGGLLLAEEISGQDTTAYHFQYDGNGNVTEITTNNGTSAATYRYDAFGNTLVATGAYASTNKYRFSTKPFDGEITNGTLYYYGYRYYDPATGRWPSRDPIGELMDDPPSLEKTREIVVMVSIDKNLTGDLVDKITNDIWKSEMNRNLRIGNLVTTVRRGETREISNLYRFIENDGLNGFDVLGLYLFDPECLKDCARKYARNLERCDGLERFSHRVACAASANTNWHICNMKCVDEEDAKKCCCVAGAGLLVAGAVVCPFDGPVGDAAAISLFCGVVAQ